MNHENENTGIPDTYAGGGGRKWRVCMCVCVPVVCACACAFMCMHGYFTGTKRGIYVYVDCVKGGGGGGSCVGKSGR